jgi:hypothetical protein
MRRSPTVLALTVAAVVPSAAAHAQQPGPLPTLGFAGACFTEQQRIPFSGTSFTPGGDVLLLFAHSGRLGSYMTRADDAGSLDDSVAFDSANDLLGDDEDRASIDVTANDQARIDAGQPPESTFAFAQFTFTRWAGLAPRRFVAGTNARVEAYGWAFATGKQAWFLFRKGSRTVASVSMGPLSAGCGDRKATIKVPRRLTPGRYRVYITTDRTLHGPYTWMPARVVAPGPRAARAAAATPRRMAAVRQGVAS